MGHARIAAGTLVVLCASLGSLVAAQQPSSTSPSDGFYTAAQAARGETAFNKYCALCHTVEGTNLQEQLRTGRGIRVGSTRALMGLGGNYLKRQFEGHPDYPSVYYLFNRIRETMPAFGAETVGIDTKLDIVAYLLQANGLPAGTSELIHNVPALRQMKLFPAAAADETGFETLFNGKDFTNFGFLLGPNCKPAPVGCGRTGPGALFRIENGVATCLMGNYPPELFRVMADGYLKARGVSTAR